MFDTTGADRSVDPLVAGAQSAVADLARDDVVDWHADAVSARLVELLELRERLDAEIIRTTAGWVRKRAWEADGALSASAWLTHRASIGRHDARRLVKAARVVNASPEIGHSLASGATSSAHVDALARVASPKREPLLAEHGELLAKQAERLAVMDFTLVARRWAALADDHLAADTHSEAQAPRNEVHAAMTMNGRLVGDFNMDAISGAQWLAALDHLEPPDPVDAPDGPRSLPERRGDALAELAARYHDGDLAGSNPPNLNVVVDVATLTGTNPDLAKQRFDLEGFGPITTAALEQLKCCSTVSRLVMASDSVVLDMGRRTRLATPAQTRAISTRDGGCVFPSCDRPPHWCDIHHVDDWALGGRTDVGRMCCLCRRHHTLIHNSQWAIVVEPDGTFRATHPIRAP